jgi:hypothetical protein
LRVVTMTSRIMLGNDEGRRENDPGAPGKTE